MARILFAGNKRRGVVCLEALVAAGHQIVGVLAHAGGSAPTELSVAGVARRLGLTVFQPDDVNADSSVTALRELRPDLMALAGYSPIVRGDLLALPPLGCVNLHGGRLPEYRGSSPMNWALINGETSITISVIAVDHGVDTGPVLAERTFPVDVHATIADVQDIADHHFPTMLCDVVRAVERGEAQPRSQDERVARYFPLRFPDDGFVLFDRLTAAQMHDRIRALTHPYPCAFSYVANRRVRLVKSKPARQTFIGEPGRIYLKNAHGLLVAASDRCLWIEQALFDDGSDAVAALSRYERFSTVHGTALAALVAASHTP